MKKATRKEQRKAKSLLKLYGIKYSEVGSRARPPVNETTVSVVLGGHKPSANIRRTTIRLLKARNPELTEKDIWEENADRAA